MERTKGKALGIRLIGTRGTYKTPNNFDVLNKLSLEELNGIRTMVQELVVKKREESGDSKKQGLKLGQIVLINHDGHDGETFKILKMNRKRAVLQSLAEQHKKYNVPYNMIST